MAAAPTVHLQAREAGGGSAHVKRRQNVGVRRKKIARTPFP